MSLAELDEFVPLGIAPLCFLIRDEILAIDNSRLCTY